MVHRECLAALLASFYLLGALASLVELPKAAVSWSHSKHFLWRSHNNGEGDRRRCCRKIFHSICLRVLLPRCHRTRHSSGRVLHKVNYAIHSRTSPNGIQMETVQQYSPLACSSRADEHVGKNHRHRHLCLSPRSYMGLLRALRRGNHKFRKFRRCMIASQQSKTLHCSHLSGRSTSLWKEYLNMDCHFEATQGFELRGWLIVKAKQRMWSEVRLR